VGRIYVIGISPGSPLPEEIKEVFLRVKRIFASERLYELLKGYESFSLYMEKAALINNVDKTISTIKAIRGDVAVIASGDPMFFGIGKRITEEVRGREVLIYPALSSLQLAFSRAGLSWHDAYIVSFHGSQKRQWPVADLPLLCERHEKLAILTGGENTPARIASSLPRGSTIWIAERLGHEDERVRKTAPAKVQRMKIKEPNIMIVQNPNAGKASAPALGLRENEFRRTEGLITKDEVRAVVLHKLRLPLRGVLWDVGAGSGSVGIEARRLAPGLEVYSIEQNVERAKNISQNAISLKAGDITVITGKAPAAFKGLPAPDRVFIGGSGAALPAVIAHVIGHINRDGIIVATAITIESIEAAMAAFKKAGQSPELTQVSVSRSQKVGKGNYMKALNPVFILKVAI